MHQQPIKFYHLEFEPSITMDSGQAFRWSPTDNSRRAWIGIISDKLVKVTRKEATILAEVDKKQDDEFILNYFSSYDDLDSILSTFPSDKNLDFARKQLRGLRLLTQDPWECLISFVCSINCNIPSIRMKIENLSRRYGRRIPTDLDIEAYTFPTAESLANASEEDLLACGLGFRWKYVRFIAHEVASRHLDLEGLSSVPYYEAFAELVSRISGKTFGVGPKVADCALLYSLHKTEAFPIDVWILRCLTRFYSDEMVHRNLKSLTPKKYFAISEIMRNKFGKYAGYAQLFLYVNMRRYFHHST